MLATLVAPPLADGKLLVITVRSGGGGLPGAVGSLSAHAVCLDI